MRTKPPSTPGVPPRPHAVGTRPSSTAAAAPFEGAQPTPADTTTTDALSLRVRGAPRAAPSVVSARLASQETGAPPSTDEVVGKLSDLLASWGDREGRVRRFSPTFERSTFALCYRPDTGIVRIIELAKAELDETHTAALVQKLPAGDVVLGTFHNKPDDEEEVAQAQTRGIFSSPRSMPLKDLVLGGKSASFSQKAATVPGVDVAVVPVRLRDRGSEPVHRAFDAAALDSLVRGRSSTAIRAMATGAVAVLLGLGRDMLRPHVRDDVDRVLAMLGSRTMARDSDVILSFARELLARVPNRTPTDSGVDDALIGGARRAAVRHRAPEDVAVVDADKDWGLRGFADDHAAFVDPAHVKSVVDATSDPAGSAHDARQAFAAAWKKAVPANVGAPLLYTDSGSAANAAVASIAAAGAARRGGKPENARLLFFDGVYGAGFGHAAGMGLGPWGADSKANLERDRILSPTARSFPVVATPELLADEERSLAMLEEQMRDPDVGAILFEPVQAFNDVSSYRPEFVRRLRELADRHGVAIVADEILTGGRRTGKMFAYEHYEGFTPDFICFGKMLQTGGIAPVPRAEMPAPPADLFGADRDRCEPALLHKGARALAAIADDGLEHEICSAGETLKERLRAHGSDAVHGVGLLIATAVDEETRRFTGAGDVIHRVKIADTTSSDGLSEKLRERPSSAPAYVRLLPELPLTTTAIDQMFTGVAGVDVPFSFTDALREVGLSPVDAVALLWADGAGAAEAMLDDDALARLRHLEARAAPLTTDAAELGALLARRGKAGWINQSDVDLFDSDKRPEGHVFEGALAALAHVLSRDDTPRLTPRLDLSAPRWSSDLHDVSALDARHLGDVVAEAGPRASNYAARRSGSDVKDRIERMWSAVASPGLSLAFLADRRSTTFEIAAAIGHRHARERVDAAGRSAASDTVNGAVLRFANVAPPEVGHNAAWPDADVVPVPAVVDGDDEADGLSASESEALAVIDRRFADLDDRPVGALILDTLAIDGLETMRPRFVDAVAELCKSKNVALIVDETHTSGGVTGTFFAHERVPGLAPDFVLFGGALGAFGVAGRSLRGYKLTNGGGFGLSTVTVEAHTALRLERALKATWERDLVGHVREREEPLHRALSRLQDSWGIARDARVEGGVAVLTMPDALVDVVGGHRLPDGRVRLCFPHTFDHEDIARMERELS